MQYADEPIDVGSEVPAEVSGKRCCENGTVATEEDVRYETAMGEGALQMSVLQTAKGVKDGRRRYGSPRLLSKEMMLTPQPSLLPSIGQVMSKTDVTDDLVELPLMRSPQHGEDRSNIYKSTPQTIQDGVSNSFPINEGTQKSNGKREFLQPQNGTCFTCVHSLLRFCSTFVQRQDACSITCICL